MNCPCFDEQQTQGCDEQQAQGCDEQQAQGCGEQQAQFQVKTRLFNWVSAILLTGWVLIVAVAAESAGPVEAKSPPLSVFVERMLK